MTAFDREVEGIRTEYARREAAPQLVGEYSFLNRLHAALVLDREAAILGVLGRYLPVALAEAEILDVGCGVGTSLGLLVSYGASAARAHGVDILEHRVVQAREQFPAVEFAVGNGFDLPYDDRSFDLVQQVTMLSSVHDPALRRQLASEMARVLRPGGIVLSYDAAPVGLLPRVLNRCLALFDRAERFAQSGGESVALTPVQPLDESELTRLFGSLETLALERRTPYRPLAERLVRRPLLLSVLLRSRPLSSALLYVGRKSA